MKKTVKRLLGFGVLMLVCFVSVLSVHAQNSSQAVADLLNRIGGEGTSDRFVTTVDATMAQNGKDVFTITAQDGKPCIKGSSTLAVTTGINWYLNHYAHVNLAWNNLTTNLSGVTLPTPTQAETHTCSADYRYYLNYCTFSYSMSTWTWERWEQEIDWMALHGINMPLQIVGLDVVWKKLLTQDLGYTSAEANKFIAGPCFQAWWGMNNLEGWGGPNPDWWYTRQEKLAEKILARERAFGMQPVLPGYAGMVPSDIAQKKGYTANSQGEWCTFTRPYILDPNSTAFAEVSEKYYKRLQDVMGTSDYYSMDPFHEGANTSGIDVASAYSKIAKAMTKANAQGKWVVQFWQWSGAQYNILSKVEKGKLIVLDLFSDAHTHFGEYQGHDAVYCMLANFGGRTGTFGRLTKVMTEYFKEKSNNSNVKGIGATPEAIEQVPVLYDALFELPWYSSAPDAKTWLANYATARYGTENTYAQEAWEKMRNSALNCGTSLQGPQEAVLCARPSLTVDKVSSWGGTEIFYDAQDVVDAAYKLLQEKGNLSGENYSYDLTDFSRQALTDYGYALLKAINKADAQGDKDAYAKRRDAYLQLLLDVDQLLNTNKNYQLGRWTNMARGIADEVSGTTEADKQWLELNNARTLITTWGDRNASEYGGLRDYSYREWGGMMKDFYYPRWKTFFDNREKGTAQPDWFTHDWNWAHNAQLSYSSTPVGNTAEVANTLFAKYFAVVTLANDKTYYAYRNIENDFSKVLTAVAYRGQNYTFPMQQTEGATVESLGIDFNSDGVISKDETCSTLTASIPTDAVAGKVTACLKLSDGTVLTFKLLLKDNVTTDRTVSVTTPNEACGSVAINGTSEKSITNKEEVVVVATPASGYDFLNWTDAADNVVSKDNSFTYYGAAAVTFTAHFIKNKWGTPTENTKDLGDISSFGQYLTSLGVSQNGSEERNIYATQTCPSSLCQSASSITAAKGSQITLHWQSAGGLGYCNLSAYIDLNNDGDFEDEGELIAAVGTKGNNGNGVLNDYTLKVLLPYEVPTGVTHIRLRFDSAWADGFDTQTGAMPAKAATARMVYDIPVDIAEKANTACKITVKASDTNGTVDANGQPDTYTYKVGEAIVLRATPASGYKLKGWIDQYNRPVPNSWVDGNFLRFDAPESGTYTAIFEPVNGNTKVLISKSETAAANLEPGFYVIKASTKKHDGYVYFQGNSELTSTEARLFRVKRNVETDTIGINGNLAFVWYVNPSKDKKLFSMQCVGGKGAFFPKQDGHGDNMALAKDLANAAVYAYSEAYDKGVLLYETNYKCGDGSNYYIHCNGNDADAEYPMSYWEGISDTDGAGSSVLFKFFKANLAEDVQTAHNTTARVIPFQAQVDNENVAGMPSYGLLLTDGDHVSNPFEYSPALYNDNPTITPSIISADTESLNVNFTSKTDCYVQTDTYYKLKVRNERKLQAVGNEVQDRLVSLESKNDFLGYYGPNVYWMLEKSGLGVKLRCSNGKYVEATNPAANGSTTKASLADNGTTFYLYDKHSDITEVEKGFMLKLANDSYSYLGDHDHSNNCLGVWRNKEESYKDIGSCFNTMEGFADAKRALFDRLTSFTQPTTTPVDVFRVATETQIQDAKTAVENATTIASLNEAYNKAFGVQPDPTAYYRIKNVGCSTSKTLYPSSATCTARSNGAVTANDNRMITLSATDDALVPQLWKFVANGDGTYKIKNANTNCAWANIVSLNSNFDMPVEDRYAGSLTLLAVPTTSQTHEGTIADINNGCSTFLIRNGEKAIQATDTHMQLAADDVTYSNAANYWQFEKVTKFSVNITDARYATVGFPFSVKITTPNVAVYYAKEAANGVLKLTQASDNVIPANQGAILYCATGPTTVDVELTEETGNFVNNQLTATTAKRVGFETLTTYGLSKNSEGLVCFRKNKSTDVPANKAYLDANNYTENTGSAQQLLFSFDNVVEGLNNVVVKGQDVRYYDLNGNRVLYPSHGIFVTERGEKVFIK